MITLRTEDFLFGKKERIRQNMRALRDNAMCLLAGARYYGQPI
jgi:hypothetical protein